MTAIAKLLSDEDIDHVSERYSRIIVESQWFTDEAAMGMVDDSNDKLMTPRRQAGKAKAAQICSNCHGLYGQATTAGNSAVVPNLSAQKREFIITRLQDFQSGARQSDQMSFIVKMLSADDITNIADWYSGVEVNVIDPLQALSATNH